MNRIDLENLQRQFQRIGSNVELEILPEPERFSRRQPQVSYEQGFTLNVRERKEQEVYNLAVNEAAIEELNFAVVNLVTERNHLLLLAKRNRTTRPLIRKSKFLCGFDERHWFAAELKSDEVTDVWIAMEALKPEEAKQSQLVQKVRVQHRHRRHNAGYVRQGEWFFIPKPTYVPERNAVLFHNEPIRRGRGKAHWVEWLYRTGGEVVWVDGNQVLTDSEFRQRQRNSEVGLSNWRQMRRGMTVYVKGAIRHPDHATIVLPFWHSVQMNAEVISTNLAFLD